MKLKITELFDELLDLVLFCHKYHESFERNFLVVGEVLESIRFGSKKIVVQYTSREGWDRTKYLTKDEFIEWYEKIKGEKNV